MLWLGMESVISISISNLFSGISFRTLKLRLEAVSLFDAPDRELFSNSWIPTLRNKSTSSRGWQLLVFATFLSVSLMLLWQGQHHCQHLKAAWSVITLLRQLPWWKCNAEQDRWKISLSVWVCVRVRVRVCSRAASEGRVKGFKDGIPTQSVWYIWKQQNKTSDRIKLNLKQQRPSFHVDVSTYRPWNKQTKICIKQYCDSPLLMTVWNMHTPPFIKYEPAYVDLEFRREFAERIEVTVMSV